MSEPIKLTTPLTEDQTRVLRAGDQIRISGVVYTARDAAHKRLVELLDQKQPLPFDMDGAIIYYVGPTPGAPDQVFGAAGPTTSYRMDAYAPRLIALGLRGMIGKGNRSPEVVDAMKQHGAVYFAATGGAGALLAKCIVKSETVAWDDLGAEALRRLEVVNFPVVVAIDAEGTSLYGNQAME
ncbi:TPA: Fe-S-containing hydro-lyase [Candidatus Sumerlaeota bacterium]|nr:Fe-S-containing hydro-lyase [Candidatus Sumerlaeota bacterium]